MMNNKLYQIGKEEFESREDINWKDFDAVDNLIASLAESAIESDGFGTKSLEEAYYIITEAFDEETAIQYLADHEELSQVA